MGIFRNDDGVGIERLFIELDDAAKQTIVMKWPDQQIRRGSRLNVDADYAAVFTNAGKVVGSLGPGHHVLDEGAPLTWGWLSDFLTADRQFDCELFFVTTRLLTGIPFGGPVDHVQDTQTGFVAGLQVYGEFAARVLDPVALVTRLTGTSGASADATVRDWLVEQVLAGVRESAAHAVAANGLYGLGAAQQGVEDAARAAANAALTGTGIVVDGFGELHLGMDDATVTQLREFAETKGYVELAGSWDQYARGKAMMNLAGGLDHAGMPVVGEDDSAGGLGSLMAAGMLFGGLAPFGPRAGAVAPVSASPAPDVAPGAAPDAVLDGLERLVKLRDAGALSDAEFEAQKHRLLGS